VSSSENFFFIAARNNFCDLSIFAFFAIYLSSDAR
jgi:hypothetical protein